MRVQPSMNILFHGYGEEGVILNLNTESYFSLNGTAIRMWELITTSESVEDACQTLANEYDAPLDTIRQDVNDFIKSLQEAGLIDISEQSAS